MLLYRSTAQVLLTLYDTPLLKDILDVTYGCIVYQEQVMQVFRTLAGYSFGRADVVRRAMAKKKHKVMQLERNAFVYGDTDENGNVLCEGAVKRGVPESVAQKIFDDMSAFSSYAFNKSHAAAYALVAYQTAYLKCHYPSEYFAALLTSVLDSAAKVSQYTAECRRLKISVLPPSVNESGEYFTPTPNGIRFGLLAIKNLGRGLIEKLIAEREENGNYTSMYDFCRRNCGREFNRRALEGLIKSGALDGLGANRRQMIYHIDQVMSVAEEEQRFAGNGQLDMFGAVGEKSELELQPMDEMPIFQLLSLEKEATGLYLSGHPMDEYSAFVARGGFTKTIDLNSGKISDGKRVVTAGVLGSVKVRQLKNKNIMATTTLEDVHGSVSITIFADAYSRYRPILHEGSIVVLTGKVSAREDRDTEILCEKLEPIPESAAGKAPPKKQPQKGLYLRISSIDAPELTSVKELLAQHRGESRVFIVCLDSGKRFEAPPNLKCSFSQRLKNDLEQLLGAENVRFVN